MGKQIKIPTSADHGEKILYNSRTVRCKLHWEGCDSISSVLITGFFKGSATKLAAAWELSVAINDKFIYARW